MGGRLHSIARKAALVAGVTWLAAMGARAQPVDPLGDLIDQVTKEAPLDAPVPAHAISHPLTGQDAALFREAVEAARRGNVNGARSAIASMSDSLARKTATWVLVDSCAESVGFFEVDNARRELAGWPRAAKRQAAAVKLLETAGKGPHAVVDWFAGAEPATPQGAMALASAYRSLGRAGDASALVKRWWREKSFDAGAQQTMLTRFGDLLTMEDHAKRADLLLYGSQLGAAREIVAMLPADQQAAAQARLALRGEARDANALYDGLPAYLQASPGVAFERAAYLRHKGMDVIALGQVANFPHVVTAADQGDRVWDERYHLTLAALRSGDAKAAYAAASDSGLSTGPDAMDAEFYAGWIALTKLHDAKAAAPHFSMLEKIATSPISRGRALYWQGRAAEAAGDNERARDFYLRASKHNTTFYGLLAGEKLGQRLTLPNDPEITPEKRAAFEAKEPIQATRLFFDYGFRDLFRTFVLNLDDTLPTLEDEAQLIDLARNLGEMDTSMKAARGAAQHGFILPGRAYPVRNAPDEGAERAFVLAITRQESGFDPYVRSGPGARGMMQLMPSTAKALAHKIGVSYSPDRLDEPDYNMRLGSHYLGQLVGQFSGSYIMAAAGYNAGPGRPAAWSGFCGDPRSGANDPIDFIECIPFSQTRNYVMRVLENVQVYRAKLAGGTAPISITADLKRGAYSYGAPAQPVVADVGTQSGR